MKVDITELSIADYDEAASFWKGIQEVGLDDANSRDMMRTYLERNPGMSFVARHKGEIAGAVLCGHDGRRGYLHHLAVLPAYRKKGIGSALVNRCLTALAAVGIRKCNIFIFADNIEGKAFWQKTGWREYEGIDLMFKYVEQHDRLGQR